MTKTWDLLTILLFMSCNMYVYIIWWMYSSLLSRGDTQSPLILTPPPQLTYLGASNPREIMVYDSKYDKE